MCKNNKKCLWKVSNFTQRCFVGILSLLSYWNKFFLRLFALFHFLLKLCSFKRENLWRNISCLFCFALYAFANYHSFRRFCWREKYHLWFLNYNTIYWIHKKYPNWGYSCWLCQGKGSENLPSSAVLKISMQADFEDKMINWKRFPVLQNKNAIASSQSLIYKVPKSCIEANEKRIRLALSNFSHCFDYIDKIMWYSLWLYEKLITKQNQQEIC